jgi:hypothetical protein
MIQLSHYIVFFLTLHITPSFATTLRRSNSVDDVQKGNFKHRLQVINSLSEDDYLLELIVNIPTDSNSNNETTLCNAMGDLLPLTEYLGMIVNESGRKFLKQEAASKHIPVEGVLWFVEFSNRRQLENENETSYSNEVNIRKLQSGYVWKVKVLCSLCSPDNGDGRMLRKVGTTLDAIGNVVAKAVQRGIQADCNMENLEGVVFDKLDV